MHLCYVNDLMVYEAFYLTYPRSDAVNVFAGGYRIGLPST